MRSLLLTSKDYYGGCMNNHIIIWKIKFFFYIISIFVFVLNGVIVYASQAFPKPITVRLSNGSKLTIRLYGDEYQHWVETLDGYTLIVNANGDYEYAKLNALNSLEPSGIQARNHIERTTSDLNFLSKIEKKLTYSSQQQSILRQLRELQTDFNNKTKAFPSTGSRKLVCILMNYANLSFTKTQADFNNLFNQVNYSIDGATGSVKDFYLENSWKQLDLSVDVVGPYTAANNMDYYGGDNTSGGDTNPRELVEEAINLADSDVNYGDYDNGM